MPTSSMKNTKLNFHNRCKKYGLESEDHNVTTEDGYILNMHRIKPNTNTNNIPIYYQHGSNDTSYGFISNQNKSPGFILAKKGYDVWCNNSRGNKYSNRHLSYDPHIDTEYWNFTFHEIGIYDSKAVLEYILAYRLKENSNNTNKIAYIGHSQGCSSMLAALSKDEKYFSDILSVFIALAPVTSLNLSNISDQYVKLFNKFYSNMTGFSFKNNFDAICTKAKTYPSPTSFKNTQHWIEIGLKARFKEYKTDENYEIKNISEVPIAVFAAVEDLICPPKRCRKVNCEIK